MMITRSLSDLARAKTKTMQASRAGTMMTTSIKYPINFGGTD